MDESESRWRVYRATFDTNIFLRALIQRGNLADNLLSLWLDGRIVLVLSQQNTSVKYTRSEIDTLPDETDWERVDALTDEDIEKAALSDPDDPPTDADFWKDATVVMPENKERLRSMAAPHIERLYDANYENIYVRDSRDYNERLRDHQEYEYALVVTEYIEQEPVRYVIYKGTREECYPEHNRFEESKRNPEGYRQNGNGTKRKNIR